MKEFNIYLVYVENKPLMIRFIGTLIEEIFNFYNVCAYINIPRMLLNIKSGH